MTRLISSVCVPSCWASLPAVRASRADAPMTATRSKTVEGVVKEFRFANPHARIILLVAAADGTMKRMGFRRRRRQAAAKRGFTADTIAKGDKITVSYNPMRNGSTGGFFVGLHDGRRKVLMCTRR